MAPHSRTEDHYDPALLHLPMRNGSRLLRTPKPTTKHRSHSRARTNVLLVSPTAGWRATRSNHRIARLVAVRTCRRHSMLWSRRNLRNQHLLPAHQRIRQPTTTTVHGHHRCPALRCPLVPNPARRIRPRKVGPGGYASNSNNHPWGWNGRRNPHVHRQRLHQVLFWVCRAGSGTQCRYEVSAR